jgi:hypothetical protein
MKSNRHNRSKPPGAGVREIDLHLKPGYTGHDAIDRQLVRFRGELESAIRAGIREIVFVHGQGSGRLRDEIREIIARDYPDCVACDALFARYGYGGATLVKINKK